MALKTLGLIKCLRGAALSTLLLFTLLAAAWASPTVVLDPGHGGTNLGAFGPTIQIHEKRLTLHLASRASSYLSQWVPGIKVILTRDRDEYVTLNERVKRANSAHGELFISIHFNAAEDHTQQGFELFLLNREASDQESARLAFKENRNFADPQELQNVQHGKKEIVQAILSDLRQTAFHAESADLARILQRTLSHARGATRGRGIRQAPFDVLMGLRMPAVLVEVGFIDHPEESRELNRLSSQEQIAVAIAAAIVERIKYGSR